MDDQVLPLLVITHCSCCIFDLNIDSTISNINLPFNSEKKKNYLKITSYWLFGFHYKAGIKIIFNKYDVNLIREDKTQEGFLL